MIASKNQHWFTRLRLLFVLLLLLLYSTPALSRVWQNAGVVALVHMLTEPSEAVALDLSARALSRLQRAVASKHNSRMAWWWLGYTLAVRGYEEEAIAAWQEVEAVSTLFTQQGKSYQQAKQYREALLWYGRAGRVAPELGKPWYEMGEIHEQMGQWELALKAYERAAVADVLIDVGRSSPYYRQGLIYQWRLEPRQPEAALAVYDRAVALDSFSDNLEEAGCHYQRGEILRWMGRDPAAYIAEYQQALALHPDYPAAYISLGLAYYIRYGDAGKAEAEIRKALALKPQNPWAYYHLGEIYRQEARIDEARAMYERAVEISPGFENALQRLRLLSDIQ